MKDLEKFINITTKKVNHELFVINVSGENKYKYTQYHFEYEKKILNNLFNQISPYEIPPKEKNNIDYYSITNNHENIYSNGNNEENIDVIKIMNVKKKRFNKNLMKFVKIVFFFVVIFVFIIVLVNIVYKSMKRKYYSLNTDKREPNPRILFNEEKVGLF